MNLVIDVGNTTVKAGIFEGENLVLKGEFATQSRKEADEWGILICSWVGKFIRGRIKKVVLASVVPSVSNPLKMGIEKYLRLSPIEVIPEKVEIPLLYDDPKQLGADRIANAIALIKLYKLPAIAVDFGTATTFDVVSQKGEYLGGVIAPGVMTFLESLPRRTERLFSVEFKKPNRVIGTNTTDNLISGIFYSCLGAVKEIIRGIKGELGKEVRVIATGGLVDLIKDECDEIDEVNPILTLQGLNFIGENWI